MKGLFVAISGPSGVGKGTIINLLKERIKSLVFVLSLTTRAPRPGEKDGEQYHFVSREDFEAKMAAGEFLETAQVHDKDYYGVLKKPVEEALSDGKVVVREVDVQGIANLKKVIPPDQLMTIFIKPENLDFLRNHIEKRSELPPEEIQRRLESVEKEMAEAVHFNYQFTNYENRLESCYLDIEGVIFSRAEQMGISTDMKRA